MTTRILVVMFVVAATVPAVPAAAATACEQLMQLSLPYTTVDGARMVPAGEFAPPAGGGGGGGGGAQAFARLPAFCRVMLSIAPTPTSDIKVEVWLPVSGWNGRLQAIGQGGLAGSIPYAAMAPALATGFAAAGSDMGHVGNNANFMPEFPEKLVDFAYRAVHEMALKGKSVIESHYGKAPARSYFNGCSGGGRHALTSAQRYPADFDGIIAGASSLNSMVMDAARIGVNRLVNRTSTSAIPASKYPMIHQAVLAACDARDGVTDGVLENPMACRFDYASLQCKAGDGPSCLTAAQVQSARALTSPLRHPVTGAVLFEGHLWPGSELEWDTLGGPEPLINALRRIRNVTYKDPKWDPIHFDTATDVELAEVVEVDRIGGESALLAFVLFGQRLVIDRGDLAIRSAAGGFPFVEVTQTIGEIDSTAPVVRTFEAEDKREGLGGVLLEPVDGEVGAHIINPTFRRGFDAVDQNRAVLIDALVNKAGCVLKSRASLLISHVPFAEVGGLISRVPQQGGVGDRVFRKRRAVVHDAVDVVVLAGEKSGATGRADRVGDEGVAEAHAASGETVHVRGFEPRVAGLFPMLFLDRAHRIPAVVVGDDEDEVGLALCGVQRSGAGRHRHDCQACHGDPGSCFHNLVFPWLVDGWMDAFCLLVRRQFTSPALA